MIVRVRNYRLIKAAALIAIQREVKNLGNHGHAGQYTLFTQGVRSAFQQNAAREQILVESSLAKVDILDQPRIDPVCHRLDQQCEIRVDSHVGVAAAHQQAYL